MNEHGILRADRLGVFRTLFVFTGHDRDHSEHRHALRFLDLDELDLQGRTRPEESTCSELLAEVISECEEVHVDSLTGLQ